MAIVCDSMRQKWLAMGNAMAMFGPHCWCHPRRVRPLPVAQGTTQSGYDRSGRPCCRIRIRETAVLHDINRKQWSLNVQAEVDSSKMSG